MRTEKFQIPLCAILVTLPFFLANANLAEAYELGSRWRVTATDGTIAGSSSAAQGIATTLTWGFLNDGVNIPGASNVGDPSGPSDLIARLDTIYGDGGNPGSDYTLRPWFHYFEESYDRWSQVAGLDFSYEPNGSGSSFPNSSGVFNGRADIRIGGHLINGNVGTLAYNYYPNGGDMVIDTDDNYFENTSNDSRRLRNVLMHEAGHGIGIDHIVSNNVNFLLEPNINTSFYGPQFDDILAAQRHYGDVWEKNGGNDILANSLSINDRFVGNTASIGTNGDTTSVGINDIDFVSIDDNADTDYFSFTVNGPSSLDVLLTPKGPTYTQAIEEYDPVPPQVSFDSSAQSDLSLRIYDASGTPLTGVINSSGLGGAESVEELILPEAGTYHVRVTGSANTVQLYQLDVTTDLDFLAGDVNLDGVVSTGSGDPFDDDVAAFVAGWQTVLPEDDDLTAWGKGDLNLDRVSDLLDAYILHEALSGAGFSNFGLFDELNVPEPTTAMLSLTALFGLLGLGRRNRG